MQNRLCARKKKTKPGKDKIHHFQPSFLSCLLAYSEQQNSSLKVLGFNRLHSTVSQGGIFMFFFPQDLAQYPKC
ncbi:hypothetical protein GDO78_011123 [Eleutherodactylus coqui]|uniref:Uncharacterized protein n=1 Tax=Eleutherodactylus coqui TaxID=57060 RepID=A0A8J6F656_ELECQ|nr:hypothetical protein GDO78_011123 [Eleutherodactylus coqui]